jgi:hypothetical protein
LLPLLQKQVGIERLVMRRPVIDLRIDARAAAAGISLMPPAPVRTRRWRWPGRTGSCRGGVRSANPIVSRPRPRGTVAALAYCRCRMCGSKAVWSLRRRALRLS